MKLYQIVKERAGKESQLDELKKEFEKKKDALIFEINGLRRLEGMGENNLDLEKVTLAETVIQCEGNVYGSTDGGGLPIAEFAIIDIATGCKHLKNQFFGNKTYGGYYQRCDCSYGYGPKHGGIADSIGLMENARERNLSDEEKDACIYYLKNYKIISEQKRKIIESATK